ncbi:lachesin-like [Dreissena polymorpha]|nr:lachesin-like [Dreissena polymorpha]
MACVVDNRPVDSQVQWLVQNYNTGTNIPISTDTDTQNAFKYQIDKPAANNWRLKIQNIQESDMALYICRVQLGGQQNANDSRMIYVVQKPQIVDIFTSSDTTKQEGDRVELRCNASGIPTPMITWHMAGGGILPTGGREWTSPTIIIPRVTREHRGDYKCIAKNEAGEDVRRIYLSVKFAPSVTVHQYRKQVFQAPGYSRTLTCEAKGHPVPSEAEILWFKGGSSLVDSNKFIKESYFGSNYVMMKLTVRDITEADYGDYKCYAENSQGNGENTVTLSRSDKFVDDRELFRESSGGSIIVFSITTLVMLLGTALLHLC